MKFEKIVLACLCFMCVIFLGGCGNKDTITNEDFKKIMEEKDYEVKDISSKMSEYDYVKSVLVATNKSSSCQIEFYILINEKNAIGLFDYNKEVFLKSKTGTSIESNSGENNYSKYTLSTDKKYMLISRIDNTLVFSNVEASNKKEVNEIINKLGY